MKDICVAARESNYQALKLLIQIVNDDNNFNINETASDIFGKDKFKYNPLMTCAAAKVTHNDSIIYEKQIANTQCLNY